MGIMGKYRQSHIQYEESHRWKRILDWEYDIDSVERNIEEGWLQVLLRQSQKQYMLLEYDKIYMEAGAASLRYEILESAKYNPALGTVHDHDFSLHPATFRQDSPIGRIYNDFIHEFGSKLPSPSKDWLYLSFCNRYIYLDLNSISCKENDILTCITKFNYEHGGKGCIHQRSSVIDLKNNTFLSHEDADFQGNQRILSTWSKNPEPIDKNNIYHFICTSIRHVMQEEYFPCPDENSWSDFLTVERPNGTLTWQISPQGILIESNEEFACQLSYKLNDRRYTCCFSCRQADQFSIQLMAIYVYRNDKNCIFAITEEDAVLSINSPFQPLPQESNELEQIRHTLHKCYQRAIRFLPIERNCLKPEDLTYRLDSEESMKHVFDSIIGLEPVKKLLLEQYRLLKVQEKRRLAGIFTSTPKSMNMVFCGNSGSGKTMIASLFAEVLYEMGLLKTKNIIETGRDGLIDPYIGGTALKVRKIFEESLGGILFIDEAYALHSGGSGDTGQEAVATLLQLINEHPEDSLVILAGYPQEMSEFMAMNPGLTSRFPIRIDFPDYTDAELTKITTNLLLRDQFILTEGTTQLITEELSRQKKLKGKDAGNGRLAKNLYDRIISQQAMRLSKEENLSKEDLLTLLPADIPVSAQRDDNFHLENELKDIVGLSSVKEYIRRLDASIKMNIVLKERGLPTEDQKAMHTIFQGSAGTGKTTIARILAKLLFHLGVIPTDNLVEVSRSDLVAGYIGQTAIKTEQVFKRAMGGILFIDEAYSLYSGGNGDFGTEAISTLVKLMEDNRDSIVVVLAGYTKEMQEFLSANSGLKSRFPNILTFTDYSIEELIEIAHHMYAAKHYHMTEAAEAHLKEILAEEKKDPYFGNARTMRNIVTSSIQAQRYRLMETTPDLLSIETDVLTTIEAEDINGSPKTGSPSSPA